MPITVTFDTNTLASVVSPEEAQRGTGPNGATVRAAIQGGLIRGFFCETLITLEGITRKERKDILGKTRVISESSSSGPGSISITVSVRHIRKPLDSRFQARVQGALELGMCALMAPARIGGGFHVKSESYPLFEPPGDDAELWRCMDEVNDMATRIARRGVGSAIAIELGVQSSKEAGISKPELWLEGLKHAQNINKVANAVREWADGDTVAAHYGFGLDLLCSEDYGDNSVFDLSNRKWLREDFGVRFVTLAELLTMLPSPAG